MALVAYDNSDSSEYEDNEDDEITVEQVQNDEPAPEEEQVTPKSENVQNIFSLLPQPSQAKKGVMEEDDEFLHKKELPTDIKPKSRITIPSLKDFIDVEDTVPTSTKSRVTNGKKSGLLSILPEPRNAVRSTTKSLIPSTIAQKPQTSTAKRKPLPSPAKVTKVEKKNPLITDYSDDSDNEDVQNDFFSINKKDEELPIEDIPLEVETTVIETKEPRSIESYFKKDLDHIETQQDLNIMQDNGEDYSLNVEQPSETGAGNSNSIALDDEAIIKLCGMRGKRRREEIQIVDVNQQEVLGDAREWLLKGLMDDTSKRQSASKKRGNEPTSQQKRKHQITYLAHQAKANEAELQNQWANNRMTKRQTQSKYGF